MFVSFQRNIPYCNVSNCVCLCAFDPRGSSNLIRQALLRSTQARTLKPCEQRLGMLLLYTHTQSCLSVKRGTRRIYLLIQSPAGRRHTHSVYLVRIRACYHVAWRINTGWLEYHSVSPVCLLSFLQTKRAVGLDRWLEGMPTVWHLLFSFSIPLFVFSVPVLCLPFTLFWTSCCGALALICCLTDCCHSTARRSVIPGENLAMC